MTREEIKKAMRDTKKEVVLKNLHKIFSLVEGYPEYKDCISYAIAKLEQEPIIDKIRKQIKSDLRGVEIALEVLEKNDPLIPKIEGAKETLENCLEIIDKAESEKRE